MYIMEDETMSVEEEKKVGEEVSDEADKFLLHEMEVEEKETI